MSTNINFNNNLGISRGCNITLASNPITPLLLDSYPNAAVAYSLRKLRNAYSGNAIRVRRSSDNAEQDIGFIGNLLDTASLLTFCGVGNGFVTTWYDQSVNNNNASIPTASSQAQIVSAGTMITDIYNGKITTVWVNNQYAILTSIPIAQNFTMFAVVTRANSNNRLFPLGSGLTFLFSWSSLGTVTSQITTGLATHQVGFTTTGDYIVSVLRDNSNVLKAFRNSTPLLTEVSTGTPTTALRFGFSQSASMTGRMQEMIFWNNQDLESSQSNIESAINSYYSVF
jgi:hypothetical protein